MGRLCAVLWVISVQAGMAAIAPPMTFEANRGQTNAEVKFLSRGGGYALFLSQDSAVFKLHGTGGKSPVVRMKLAGANSGAEVRGGEPLSGAANYFIGSDPRKWIRNAPTYGRVEYRQVYRGVDLVYYGTEGKLEYDFVVAPGVDPRQIALEFSGAQPSIGRDGDLMLEIDGAPLCFRKPAVYQMNAGRKEPIAGSYQLDGKKVRFRLGDYDHSRELVIDPVLVYFTYLGGSANEFIGSPAPYLQFDISPSQSIAADAAGNVYV